MSQSRERHSRGHRRLHQTVCS